jgi:outer membrane protein assembly factor BamD
VKIRSSHILTLVVLVFVAWGCSKHQKLLKSADNEAKYAAAIDYFENQDYYRALQLFQPLNNFYRGTEKSEKIQYYMAYCYYKQRDYLLASYYFRKFAENYPRSEYTEEAVYLSAYCYYLNSPKPSLDQSNTRQAITELQLFIDMYPQSERVEEAYNLIDELSYKLQEKQFDIAKLYYKMQQYKGAVTSFETLLKDYPDTEFKEQILYYIFKSYYGYTLNSVSRKRDERYQAALDSYNELVFQFPETTYKKEVANMT